MAASGGGRGMTALGRLAEALSVLGCFRFCPEVAVLLAPARGGGRVALGPSRWMRDQVPGPLATTVKLGRASAGLVLCTTLNAAIGRRKPLSSRFPRPSSLATASTASAMRLLTRIWPSFASAQSRAARLQTVL